MELHSCNDYNIIYIFARDDIAKIIKMNNLIESFKCGAKEFSKNLAVIVNTVLLSIVYIIGIGITSITAKMFKKKFLETQKKKKTYWSDLNLKKKSLEEYYRQF